MRSGRQDLELLGWLDVFPLEYLAILGAGAPGGSGPYRRAGQTSQGVAISVARAQGVGMAGGQDGARPGCWDSGTARWLDVFPSGCPAIPGAGDSGRAMSGMLTVAVARRLAFRRPGSGAVAPACGREGWRAGCREGWTSGSRDRWRLRGLAGWPLRWPGFGGTSVRAPAANVAGDWRPRWACGKGAGALDPDRPGRRVTVERGRGGDVGSYGGPGPGTCGVERPG